MLNYEDISCLKQEKEKLVREMMDQCKQNGNIGTIDTYAHTIKNMCKIIEEAEKESGGYSGYSGMNYSGYQPNMRMDQNGYSGARNRDSMGRYASHGDMKAHLYEAMNSASNDMERQNIQNLINSMP